MNPRWALSYQVHAASSKLDSILMHAASSKLDSILMHQKNISWTCLGMELQNGGQDVAIFSMLMVHFFDSNGDPEHLKIEAF